MREGPEVASPPSVVVANTGLAAQPLRTDSPWRQVGRRFVRNRLALVGAIVLVFLALVALLAPYMAPYRYDAIDLFNMKAAPSAAHWMGTDELGRDVFTRILYGTRVSLSVGLCATAICVAIGTVIGAVGAYFGGLVDNLFMRFVDIMLCFPTLFLLIILASYVNGLTPVGIIVVIGVTGWMGMARMVRGSFLTLKEQDFTDAARALGASDSRIIFRHLLPNALGPLFVSATLMVGGSIMYESALSYLGVGIIPPAASWGNMLSNAQDFLADAWWLAFFPGLMIFITVLCINFVGDGLRDAFDPKMRK